MVFPLSYTYPTPHEMIAAYPGYDSASQPSLVTPMSTQEQETLQFGQSAELNRFDLTPPTQTQWQLPSPQQTDYRSTQLLSRNQHAPLAPHHQTPTTGTDQTMGRH